MILGVLAMIAANAAVCLGARGILDGVRSGKPGVDAVLFLLLRILLISAVVLLAGTAHLLAPLWLGGAAFGALGFLVGVGAHRRIPKLSLQGVDRWLLVVAAVVVVRLLFHVWYSAPYGGDAMAYHLPKIAEWVRAGGFTHEMGPDQRAAFPAGFELVETWWVVFLHHDALIEMAGVEFLLLAAASAYALASEFGWGPKAARIAALLFAMAPNLYSQATTCLNDGPVASLLAAAAALVVARAHPALLVVAVGLGIGVKPTFAFAVPGLALTGLLMRKEAASPVPSARTAVAFAMLAQLAGAFWYVRNWWWFGNPIHPMGSGGIRSQVTGSQLQQLGPGWPGFRDNLLMFFDVRVYDALDHRSLSNLMWGGAAFALGVPALVFLLRSEPLLRRLAAGLAVSFLTVMALVQPDPWNARFVMIVTLLPCLALARVWERHRFVAVLAGAALTGQFLATMVPLGLTRGEFARIARQDVARRASMPPPVAPGDAVLGYHCSDFGATYGLYGPSFSRRVVFLRDESLESLLETLRREKVAVFYAGPAGGKTREMFEEGVRRDRLRPFTLEGMSGYQVVPAP